MDQLASVPHRAVTTLSLFPNISIELSQQFWDVVVTVPLLEMRTHFESPRLPQLLGWQMVNQSLDSSLSNSKYWIFNQERGSYFFPWRNGTLVKGVDRKAVGMRECRKRGSLTVQGAVATKKRHRWHRHSKGWCVKITEGFLSFSIFSSLSISFIFLLLQPLSLPFYFLHFYF